MTSEGSWTVRTCRERYRTPTSIKKETATMDRRSCSLIALVAILILPLQVGGGSGVDVWMEGAIDRVKTSDGSVFIENLGQLNDPSVLFYTEGDPSVLVRNGSVSLRHHPDGGQAQVGREELRLEFSGSSPGRVYGTERTDTVHNFYLSEREEDWIELARSFERVVLEDAYQGISVELLLEDGWPKYELHCRPGSDPTAVSVVYRGASSLRTWGLTNLQFEMAGMLYTEGPLVAYQESGPIECSYRTEGGSVSFDIGPYDPMSTLVIDPLLKAATYVGGNSWDRNAKLEKGTSGDIYMVGNVESYDLYTHPGSYDPTHNGERDIYICRMSGDLSSLLFATYLGGTLYDDPADVCLDNGGNLLVSGLTNSSDLPTTASTFDRTYNGGGSDSFISSFDGQLGTLRFSTYIGGSGMDHGRGIACTSTGEPVLVGISSSTDLPVTSNAYQAVLKGTSDIFLLKLKADGTSVLNCTYIGGTSWGEQPYALELDGSDRPVIAGHMLSEDYPTTSGAFQERFGFYMGFVTKMDTYLEDLEFSTFFGNGTWIRDIELDGSGNVYMTGRTVNGGGHFPVTAGAFDTTFTGEEDAFVARLSSDGSAVDFASFLGADENYGGVPNFDYYEGGSGIDLLDDGRPAVCGYTDSTHFPLSADAFDRRRDLEDAFLTVFNADCSAVDYSTFLGGTDEDKGTSVLFCSPNLLYIAGETYSNYPSHDFPVTPGAYDTTFSVGYDHFIASFKMDSLLPGPPYDLSADWGNKTVDLTWRPPVSDGGEPVLGYRIYRGVTPTSKKLVFETRSNLSYIDINLTNGVRYHYSVRAFNVVGEGPGTETSAVPMTVPGPPVPIDAVPGDGSLNVTFGPPLDTGGATSLKFNVFLSNGSGPYTLAASNLSGLYCLLSGLMNGRSYNVSFSATNLAGEGIRSGTIQGVPRKRPGPPRYLEVSPLDGGAVLSWSPPADDGGAWNLTYRLYGGGNLSSIVLLRDGLERTGPETLSLENGRTYFFLVSAVNEMGEGARAGPVTTNPLGVPSEPWNLSAKEGADNVDLKWDAPNSTGGYVNLTYQVSVSSESGDDHRTIEVPGAMELNVPGLSQGVPYTFSVRAFNTRFYGPWSANLTVVIYNLPGAPTDLLLVTGDGRLNLTWVRPANDGGHPDLLFEVHFGEKDDSVYYHGNTTSTAMAFTGLRNGKTYYFMVKARNIKGAGPFSEMVSGTPMRAPSRPENLKCQIGDGSLNVTWERPGDDGGDPSIVFDVLFAPKGSSLVVIRQGTVRTSIFIDDLVNGVEYEIAVLAFNSMGMSPPASTYATPMTVPGIPATLNATWEGAIIVVRWLPPEDDGGGAIWIYHIYRGEEVGSMTRVMRIDSSARSWTDVDVIRGTTYYYSIRAENPLGLGDAAGPVKAIEPWVPEKVREVPWAYIGVGALIAFLVIFIIVMFVLSRNERRRDWKEE